MPPSDLRDGWKMMSDQVGICALSKDVLDVGCGSAGTTLTFPGHRKQDDVMGRNLPHELGDERCNFESEDGGIQLLDQYH